MHTAFLVLPPLLWLAGRRERCARAHGQSGHVVGGQRPAEQVRREHEVHLPRAEHVAGGQRRGVLVEVERVGVAHEGRRHGRVAVKAEHVGDGREGARRWELLQRAVGGDDPAGWHWRVRPVYLPRDAASVEAGKPQQTHME